MDALFNLLLMSSGSSYSEIGQINVSADLSFSKTYTVGGKMGGSADLDTDLDTSQNV